ncbi:hypothetical protein BGZ70_005437 [Mortierella alpina]|uniref:Ser-Thr-rich glycosyl-phosphatidyl-inositol-anchored membrane family-domain-containing protein n=1 Tax=Mortierella alpina TaxID=64518 RepID=A0A9P6J922_MORAP|nr:hypothetical protein BGZ70_005437 [Mortierella alpina]
MRFSVAALAATLIGAVMAQQAYPTAPIGSTVWTVGKSATISWKLNATAKGVPLAITLFKGDPTHQTQVQELSPDSYSAQFVIETAAGVRPSGAPPSATAAPSAPVVASPSAAPATKSAASNTTAPTATGSPKAAPVSAGSYLSAGPLAVAAAAVVAAALAL